MKKTFLFIVFLTLILRGVTTAQNPYESLGVPMPKGKMLTLSNGKFQEFFPNDTLTPIGSAMFNTVTGEIVQFITRDTMYAEYNLEPELVSRWLSPDPLAEKYMQWSPYNFVLGNPIKYIDPDGQDVILVIWASHDGKIGHAGIAVANYKQVTEKIEVDGKEITRSRMVHDGTYTYRDLWPGNEGGVGKSNYDKDVKASYNNKIVTMDDLMNKDVTGNEGQSADGVIQLTTNMKTDEIVTMGLDAFEKSNQSYNGVNCNCSDFVEDGLEYAVGKSLPVDEKLTEKVSATTPNQLFKTAKDLPNATVLKDPGNKVNSGFLDAVSNGNENKVRKKID